MPKRHKTHFGNFNDGEISALARIMHLYLGRLEVLFPNLSYNLVLHTGPLNLRGSKIVEAEESFHCHLEIMPRFTETAGFEWATDFFVNHLSPRQSRR